jgi:hypothetical protein
MSDGDDNTRAAWVCAIWCGVATLLIQERRRREPPMTEKAVHQVRAAIENALRGHPYLEGPAAEALAALEAR